jgi:hypothetical protein
MVFILSFSSNLFALVVERVAVQNRIINSDAVFIVEILNVSDASDKRFTEKSTAKVLNSSLKGYEGKNIKFYHSEMVVESDTHCCGAGSTYVLFLKRYKDGYISSSGRYGAYEIIKGVPLFLDETWMKTSQEHAETLLFLHTIYQASSTAGGGGVIN